MSDDALLSEAAALVIPPTKRRCRKMRAPGDARGVAPAPPRPGENGTRPDPAQAMRNNTLPTGSGARVSRNALSVQRRGPSPGSRPPPRTGENNNPLRRADCSTVPCRPPAIAGLDGDQKRREQQTHALYLPALPQQARRAYVIELFEDRLRQGA